MPVLASNVVATSQPLAAQAGLSMLAQGGNAVDAALAAAIALTVVEPVANGIGGDGFALVWDGAKLHGLNASGRAPKAWNAERFAGLETMPERGWDTVTVPGAVSAWAALSERFGKLPFERLFEPAIRYAREGFLVSPVVAVSWASQAQELKDLPGFAEAFLRGGRAPLPGERFTLPDQATTLERIAETRGEAFYRGDLAEKICAFARAQGGALALEDLASHRCDWVEPVAADYRGFTLHELPPNNQGVAALMALTILGEFDLAAHGVDSAGGVHLQLEAMKLAFADVYRFVADPAAMELGSRDLLNPDYLKRRAQLIDPQRAQDHRHGAPRRGGTVMLTTGDAEGMMVSFIQSTYKGFGSGVVVPGTGIAFHNRGCAFSLEAGHPNQVAGGKRPFHTLIPAFVMRDGAPLMAFGVMGAAMQAQGHVQMLVRLADYGQNPQAASDAPRWRVNEGLQVQLEHGFDSGVAQELARRGHRITRSPPGSTDFGGAQFVCRLAHGYLAASDHRKDGQAVGF
ncbi:MAG: gamma-glutamyltransferase family protein [Betaproteobacteria bacterium]|nr:gamma-glutamyltransferase family protein [Betaproteobacteria bacterium]